MIRMKRLRAARAVDDFMRMPQRIIMPDHLAVNMAAVERENRLWAIPDGPEITRLP